MPHGELAAAREYDRGWRAANPEKTREKNRRWRAANLERVREYNRRWAAAHREQVRENSRRWQAANPEKNAARIRQWQVANLEKVLAKENRRRARLVGNGGSFTAAEWLALLDRTGHKCLACLRPEGEVKLTVDHIIPLSRGGRNDITNIQPLCQSCNSRKGVRILA